MTNIHSFARPTEPASSHEAATRIANRKTGDTCRRYILRVLLERGPVTLDELTTDLKEDAHDDR